MEQQWKKKWFVLRATKLAYYKDNREYSLSRAIDLRQVHSCVPISSGEKQKHPFAFAIVTSDRTFLVEALSNEEREDWVKAINIVRKRMTDREEEANRRRDPSATRAVPVPARPAPATGHEEVVEPHQGTWTSTFSNTTASTSPAQSQSGSYFHHIVHPQNPAAASAHAHVAASSSVSSTLTAQLATLSTARTPSINAPGPGTAGPSAASVTRRLSHPIPVPNIQTSRLDGRLAGGPTSPINSNLSPPNATPHLGASSDEDEAYFSDPHTAWADLIATSPPTNTVADPNKVILATYLMKRSRKPAREVWRKRWFFLTSAGITYTKSHMDSRVLTFIGIPSILDVFSLEDADDDGAFDSSGAEDASGNFRHPSLKTKRDNAAPPRNIEHVIRIVTSKRRYDLCVPSEEEEIKWIAAIRALVNRERERQAASAVQPPISPLTETAPTLKAPGTAPAPVPIIAQQPPTPGSQSSPLLGGNATQVPPVAVPAVPQPAPAAPTTHNRTRSATQVAKNAVAEATRRYVEVGKQ
ncbi:hypothetical protein VHUM_00803 [Vanrija humicola]|uniref:PH domain-containing protein n=1 Tax=Vanrija humicola TaxID=5417 RepID=A0A7D8Z931_VANHU|nr:hypothetical protein VHUM_00803 [Vanrija humicola]